MQKIVAAAMDGAVLTALDRSNLLQSCCSSCREQYEAWQNKKISHCFYSMPYMSLVVSIIPYHETRAPCIKNGAEQVPAGPRRGAGDTRLFYRGRATVGSLHHNETGASEN